MKHQALILRVGRNSAGVRFPFDKVYFFKKEARKCLTRIYRCALVIVPSKTFIELLTDTTQHHACSVGKVYPMQRRDEEQCLRQMHQELPISDVVSNYKNYLGLIPILFLQNRNNPEKISPQYLRATLRDKARRIRKKKSAAQAATDASDNMLDMFQDTFTSDSYFIMDGEEYSPVCAVCPNSLGMVTGQCRLGGNMCFDKLSQVNSSNFRVNMKKYLHWLRNVGEPELKLEAGNE